MKKYPICSKRLELHPYTIDLWRDKFELLQYPETHRFNYSSLQSEEEVKESVQKLAESNYQNPKGRMELAIIHRGNHKYIGLIGLKCGEFKPEDTAEVYYTLNPQYFNQGYATEAVTALLRFGFDILKLHRIWAGATVENIASWRVMEKVGMRKECTWLKDRPKPGPWVAGKGFAKTKEWEDGYGYAILREESFGKKDYSY